MGRETTKRRLRLIVSTTCALGVQWLAGTAFAQEPPPPIPDPPSDVIPPPADPAPAPAPAPGGDTPSSPEPPAAAPTLPPAAPSTTPPPSPTPAAPAPAPPSASFPAAPPAASPAPATAPPDSAAAPAPLPTDTASTPLDAAPGAPPDRGEDPRPRDEQDGLFGPFRIGPLFGLGLPSLLNFGGAIKLTRYFGAGINIGIVPELHFSYYGEAKVSYQSYDAFGHIHPFGGGFFVGARIGYATVNGSYETDYRVATTAFSGTVTVQSEGNVKTMVLTPELGFLYTFGSGFTFGVDAGVQVPVAPSRIEFTSGLNSSAPFVPPGAETASDDKVRDTLERVGRTILPTFHLRIGWML